MRLNLEARPFGPDLLVLIYNENPHAGSCALGLYDQASKRAYASTLSAPGHRDDRVARRLAEYLAGALRRPVCVVCGIHLPHITPDEIAAAVSGAEALARDLAVRLGAPEGGQQ